MVAYSGGCGVDSPDSLRGSAELPGYRRLPGLLTLLGVDGDTVLDDYEPTSECQRPRLPEVVELFVASGMARDAAEGVLGTPRWAMARALSELDDAFGGIEPYLLGPCGIAPETITALRKCLTS